MGQQVLTQEEVDALLNAVNDGESEDILGGGDDFGAGAPDARHQTLRTESDPANREGDCRRCKPRSQPF